MDFYSGGTDRRLSVGRRVGAVAFFAVITCALPADAGKRNVEILVESNPPGAMVSVHTTGDTELGGGMVVAGETPLTKNFRFPKNSSLWLRLEKRGYEPQVVEIELDASRVSVDLAIMDGGFGAPEPVRVLAVLTPELTVIRRGFAKEREDEEAGAAAATVIIRAVEDRLAGRVEIVEVSDDDHAAILRPLWRDARSQMELVDPIRLPYMPALPRLESRAARAALLELAERTGADAVIFVAGKANLETGGMKAGKIGIMAVGTASSFASGYSNAMANGNDFFNRNMPQVFDKIVEVDSATATGVDVVVEIAIVRFEAKIPHPASNPYTATMVYKITVTDADGETLLVQTVTGDGQTSKGMMSGFKAKQLAGESAARAMTDAGRQALEALAEAPELAEVRRP